MKDEITISQSLINYILDTEDERIVDRINESTIDGHKITGIKKRIDKGDVFIDGLCETHNFRPYIFNGNMNDVPCSKALNKLNWNK